MIDIDILQSDWVMYDQTIASQKYFPSTVFAVACNRFYLGTHLRLFSEISVSVRSWPNDQTLFVKYLKFDNQTKCFTVWSRRKTLLVKNHCWRQAKNVFHFSKTLRNKICLFACQVIFCDLAKRSSIEKKISND